MTEIRSAFPEIDQMEIHELQQLEAQITASVNGDWRALADDNLTRYWKVMIALRRKAAHAGSKGKRNNSAPKKEKASSKSDSDDLI